MKLIRFLILIFAQLSLFAADFDCIVVGSSPFSLFEALYQCHTGKKVLILEESSQCGGAWKGINICGVMHADLGCHQIGNNTQLKQFLEEYAGCEIVSLDYPHLPFEEGKGPNGWYFSRGCYELVENLLQLISNTDIVLLTENKVENVSIDTSQNIAVVQTKNRSFTTEKLIVTPMSSLNFSHSNSPQNYGKSRYFHLYLLIQDPTPPCFTYRQGLMNGVSRMMNLTPFVGLLGTGRQLIVVQTHGEQNLANGQIYLEALKSNKLIDEGAYILQSEPYIYETGAFHQGMISQIGAQRIVEVLQTGHFQNLNNYVPKWKQALKPFRSR
jgi:hypothetical protein